MKVLNIVFSYYIIIYKLDIKLIITFSKIIKYKITLMSLSSKELGERLASYYAKISNSNKSNTYLMMNLINMIDFMVDNKIMMLKYTDFTDNVDGIINHLKVFLKSYNENLVLKNKLIEKINLLSITYQL